jgi:hypothetical protein
LCIIKFLSGLLEILSNALFVKQKLKEIFDYRKKVIEERFGKWE